MGDRHQLSLVLPLASEVSRQSMMKWMGFPLPVKPGLYRGLSPPPPYTPPSIQATGL